MFIAAIAQSFLNAYIVMSISWRYDVFVVTNCTYEQIFGVMLLLGFLKHKTTKDEDFDKWMVSAVTRTFVGAIGVLVIWGVAFLIHYTFFR